MAITLLPGKLLESNLLRDSVDLSVETDLIHFDVNSNTVNIGTATPVSDVEFQIATTGSAMLPKGTTLERPTIPVTGMIRYNTDLTSYEYYDGAIWGQMGNAYTNFASDTYTGTTNTIYTLSSSQTTASVILSINGIVQIPGTSYTVSGTTLTLSEAPLTTDIIEVRTLTTTSTVNSLTDGTASITPAGTQHDITGDLIPTVDITYDLGSATNRWQDLYLSGATIDMDGLKIKIVGGEFVFTEADGTTPASVSATVTDIDGGTY